MLNGFCTIKEAAEIMKLSETYIRTLCSAGRIEGAQKVGGSWFIPEDAAKNYKPRPKGFAAVWERLREQEAALNERLRQEARLNDGELGQGTAEYNK